MNFNDYIACIAAGLLKRDMVYIVFQKAGCDAG